MPALSGIQTHDPNVRAGEEFYALDRAVTMIGIEDSKLHKI
jgi:hypothetical protein